MINVTVGEQKTQSEKPFPKLMLDSHSKRIVFFIGFKKGLQINVINSESYYLQLNPHYSEFWNMDNFTDYNEPITIQNA